MSDPDPDPDPWLVAWLEDPAAAFRPEELLEFLACLRRRHGPAALQRLAVAVVTARLVTPAQLQTSGDVRPRRRHSEVKDLSPACAAACLRRLAWPEDLARPGALLLALRWCDRAARACATRELALGGTVIMPGERARRAAVAATVRPTLAAALATHPQATPVERALALGPTLPPPPRCDWWRRPVRPRD